MKIAFVTPLFVIGGAETYIIRKATWLQNCGHEVIIISEGGKMVEMLPNGIRHFKVSGISKMPYAHSPLKLRRILKSISTILAENGINVIEAHNTAPILYVGMSYRYHHIPYLLNVLLEISFDRNPQLCKFTKVLAMRNLYYTLTFNMHLYIENKCRVLLPVHILPIPISLPYISTPLTVGDFVLTVGRLTEDKMYLRAVIKSFGIYLQSKIGGAIRFLYVVGDGILREDINRLANDVNASLGYEAIVMKGTVVGRELNILYEKCIAFVGVGTALLIAASYRKPIIIASGFIDLRDYAWGYWGKQPTLDKDSIAGNSKYYHLRQPFEEAISRLSIDDEFRISVANKAFELFKEVYDMDKVMVKWESNYNEICKKEHDTFLTRESIRMYIVNSSLFPLYYIKKLINKILI